LFGKYTGQDMDKLPRLVVIHASEISAETDEPAPQKS
jgi:hypothetical protein